MFYVVLVLFVFNVLLLLTHRWANFLFCQPVKCYSFSWSRWLRRFCHSRCNGL